MTKINIDLEPQVIRVVAEGCGFSVTPYSRLGEDEWKLFAGRGATYVEYVGTKQVICAFLQGYVEMKLQATMALQTLENVHARVLGDTRTRLGIPTENDT